MLEPITGYPAFTRWQRVQDPAVEAAVTAGPAVQVVLESSVSAMKR